MDLLTGCGCLKEGRGWEDEVREDEWREVARVSEREGGIELLEGGGIELLEGGIERPEWREETGKAL